MKAFQKMRFGALAGAMVLLAACGGSSGGVPGGGTPTWQVVVSDQDLLADDDPVTVTRVVALGAAWIVIYEDDAGGLGTALVMQALSEGTSNNIMLDAGTLSDGQVLHAVVHEDLGTEGVFEPGTDTIAQNAARADVRESFEINVVEPAIVASNQTLTNLSTVVTVAEASHTADGWVVVRDGGDMVLGQTLISAGVTADVTVMLSRPAVTETLTAALHDDAGTLGVFDGVGTDTIVNYMAADVEDDFNVTVNGEVVPAVRITVTNNGTSDYRWVSVAPTAFAGVTVTVNGLDTAMSLTSGWRYEIVNLAPTAHPFQVMDGATILLSQGAVGGTLEGDGDVDWIDSAGTIGFTFAGALAANADQYRCAVHSAMMIGDINP